MNILVATPVRIGTPQVFYDISKRLYDSLSFAPKERALFENDETGRDYRPYAEARNKLIDHYLKDYHTHVLWMDVDLVNVPPNLIQRLAETGQQHIVAPFVLLDKRDKRGYYPFYDTSAFIKDGEEFTAKAPYCKGGGIIVEVDSVGTCYLIPAEVYRQGGRYDPVAKEVCHITLMGQAKAMGYHVFARRDVVVLHADMDKMGFRGDKPPRQKPRRPHVGI